MYQQGERIDLAAAQGASTNGTAFVVMGGSYALHVEGTLGAASFLQVLHPSGNWANWGVAVTADTVRSLPPGKARFTTGLGASGVTAWLVRIADQAVADELVIEGDFDSRYVLKAGDTMTGALKLPNGSASAPSLAFNTNYGLFYDSANTALGLAHAGVQSGYFGPAEWRLTVPGGTAAIWTMQAEAGTAVNNERYTANTAAPSSQLRKARGTIASPAVPALNDLLGAYRCMGWTSGTTFTTSSEIRTVLIETGTVSASAMGGSIRELACAIGSGTLTEIARWEVATGLSMFGANPVIDANRLLRLRSFTVATLPAAVQGGTAMATDALAPAFGAAVSAGGAVKTPVYSDGAGWLVG